MKNAFKKRPKKIREAAPYGRLIFHKIIFQKDKQRRKARKNSCTNEGLQEECLTSCVGTFIIKYRIKVRESERRKQHGIREV
jgi:hypothetical protein